MTKLSKTCLPRSGIEWQQPRELRLLLLCLPCLSTTLTADLVHVQYSGPTSTQGMCSSFVMQLNLLCKIKSIPCHYAPKFLQKITLLLIQVVNHPVAKTYPPSSSYRQAFLKRLMTKVSVLAVDKRVSVLLASCFALSRLRPPTFLLRTMCTKPILQLSVCLQQKCASRLITL